MTTLRQDQLTGLLYLTYHENVLRAGILHTQVVKMLERLAGLKGITRIVLLSYLSPQSLWRDRNQISSFRQRMADCGVTVILLPMLIPARWKFPSSLLIYLWALPTLMVALFSGCRIVHSRGYAAAMIAQAVAKVLRLRTVFDPRGPYPAEMVMNGIWRQGSVTERFWSRVENRLIKAADAVIGVTPEFRNEFQTRGARCAIFVPNRTDTEAFRKAVDAANSAGPSQNGVELLFIGELHSVWNDPGLVARHFIGLGKRFSEARLRMITTANPAKASGIFKDIGADLSRITFASHRPEEMPRAMQGATFGLIFRAIDIHSIWSVKIAEYLAAGIPLIVDKSMVGLPLKIIREKKLGVVIDPDDPADYDQLITVVQEWQEWSMRCMHYTARRLDLRSTARQHLRLYRAVG